MTKKIDFHKQTKKEYTVFFCKTWLKYRTPSARTLLPARSSCVSVYENRRKKELVYSIL